MKLVLRIFLLIGILATAGALLDAAEPVVLTGIVSSQAEGNMEGVLVSAKRAGGTITVTVVSDRAGRFNFTANLLAQGEYELSIRATGYEMANPEQKVNVGSAKIQADVHLKIARDSSSQMTDSEWLTSMPGTPEQKEMIYENCVLCHTLTPALKSTYDVAGWKTTFQRMWNWASVSAINKPVPSPVPQGAWRFGITESADIHATDQEFAEYLAGLNMSTKSTFNFKFKTLPRPRGEDTKVVVTEYDLPRADAQPHDAVSDADGIVWYTDYAEGIVGRLDPRTGEIKEFTDPLVKEGYADGFHDIQLDPAGNPWVGRHEFNGFAMFDKKAEKFVNWSLPEGVANQKVRTNFLAPTKSGKVWVKDNTDHKAILMDPLTKNFTGFDQFPAGLNFSVHGASHHNIYGMSVDSLGNEYGADIDGGAIVEIEAETGKAKLFTIPTSNAGPRRMHMDSQDRLWIGESFGNKIGMLDTRTGKFQEWAHPIPWYGPYDVAPAKDGWVWTGGMSTDFITRLNPQTGEFRTYLLPRVGVNVRRVDVNNSGPDPVFWIGENHQAKIAKVEILN
jgi:virginiamycin B lyase